MRDSQRAKIESVAVLGPLDAALEVSIVIVSHNTRELLCAVLASLREAMTLSYDVIVVDNASTDGTTTALSEHYSEVRVVENAVNVGFARATNQGLALARGRYLLLLNSDTLVHKNAVEEMVRYLNQHETVGVVGPRLLNSDGTTQTSIIPFRKLHHDLLLLLQVTDWPLLGMLLQRVVTRRNVRSAAQTGAVDALLGACLLLRRAAIEDVGVLDPGYFFTWEEIDLCYRLMKAGWGRTYVVSAEVTHFGGQSWRRLPAGQILWLSEGRLRYYYKNHPWWQFSALRVCTALSAGVHVFTGSLQSHRNVEELRAWRRIFALAWRTQSWLSLST